MNHEEMEPVLKDPIVEEFRRAGNAYAESFDHNLDAMCDDLRRRQREGGAQVVSYAVEEDSAPVAEEADNTDSRSATVR